MSHLILFDESCPFCQRCVLFLLKRDKKNKFKFQQKNNKILIDHYKDNFLNNVKKKFNKFVLDNNYDLQKIETLTAIIFLNMSAMHQSPFNHFIFNLGRQKLQRALKNFSK